MPGIVTASQYSSAMVVVESELPVDLTQTLRPLRHGGALDPCVRLGPDGVWRATRFGSGPATMHLRSLSPTRVRVEAWGPGADEALATAPDLLGAADSDGGLEACPHRSVRRMAKQLPGLRMSRSGNPFEAIVPVILAQKVQGQMASRSFCAVVRAAATPAPAGGPGAPRLLLPPTATWLADQPSWAWHRWGVERKRAATIRCVATYADHIRRTDALPASEAAARLQLLPGVGPWTAAEVGMIAFGDADAVSVGDFWLKHWVCHNLAGEVRGTDERMLELLEAWPGQRGRVCRVINARGSRPPRFGPRLPFQDIGRL